MAQRFRLLTGDFQLLKMEPNSEIVFTLLVRSPINDSGALLPARPRTSTASIVPRASC